MGTTLQNGLYLPNEGEKNCYAGLKLNWETLDAKIADITALQEAVAGALHREIVASLPTTDIDPNTIYMILSGTSATENVYNEFMYVNNAWELIGTSATDLTNYYTKAEVDGKLLLKASASDLTSHTGDTTIHVTASDKAKWNTVALPIGSYIQFAGSQAPDGFLVCNGGEISRTTYSALFAVIGTTYGSGDGSTTFNLPNLTDRFLQGSTTVGTVKSAGLPNITGKIEKSTGGVITNSKVSGSGAFSTTQASDLGISDGARYGESLKVSFDASYSNSIYGNSTTVQPPALTCLICIKY